MSDLQSLPSSDSESNEPEYLMNTRERRSNAGNRMKALLQQEVDEMQQRTEHLDQDELDLLFKEDEDDEDFDLDPLTRRKSQTNEESELESIPKDDEDQDLLISSDSDISDSEATKEGSEEEAQIQREEKLQKRKRQKLKKTTIIKRKNISEHNEPIKKKKRSNSVQLNPESLLQAERRTSKRSSVVANKLKVYENLSQAEHKRKIIRERLKKTREKATEHILTQEDRMRIALETEKFNHLSLNKYKELELSKKQNRLALQQREKIKFKPKEIVQTLLSTTWNISPEVEIEDELYWSNELKKREKKKRKYVRKSKKKEDAAIDTTKSETNATTDIDKKDSQSEVSSDLKRNILEESIKKEPDIAGPPVEESNITEEGVDSILQTREPIERTGNDVDTSKTMDSNVLEEVDGTIESTDRNSQEDNTKYLTETIPTVTKDEIANIYSNSEEDHNQENSNEKNIKKQVSFDVNPSIEIIENTAKNKTTANEEPTSPNSSISSQESTPQPVTSTNLGVLEEPKLIYEGPLQQVSKNFLTKFSIKQNLTFTPELESPYFFDYITPDRNVISSDSFKPIIHSRLSEDDMIAETEGLEKENIEILPNLDILTTFRNFGEFDRKFEKVLKVSEIKNEDIKINTPAPMGIYTENNNVKKLCLINNKSCKYFDPNLGVPYSDLTSYKVIQDIQNSGETGEYKWFGFRNGGVYLKAKERHAMGVPKGF
ncbi:hypothetical protein C6P45_003144 [Maudiozyma exigua]|uniref:Vps72/YL1 C-terminal domain-containing protein n=1 Tax=Maudiozyma exigua TaxID=34358 RepID=A0A9P6VVP9_MAUEX|nr:hypothetical protein C6P45_003144 [Kazachstania exigua]